MGTVTQIEWTDHTFNPWWGCLEVSPGCEHCYARDLAERFGRNVWGPPHSIDRMVTSASNWRKPLQWNAVAERGDVDTVRGGRHRLVFCASMADVFEFHPQLDAVRDRLWRLIEATPWLDWQLLTKRPMNIARMLPATWLDDPRRNVWLGTSVEDQKRAELRIPHLVEVPAAVHFLSCEPLLGPLDLHQWLGSVQWIISGGESGPSHRRFEVDWVRDLNTQCTAAGAAHFFKQHGGRTHTEGGCLLDGAEVKEFPTPALPVAA